jgi:putative ABC transport system ATP-binding protein
MNNGLLSLRGAIFEFAEGAERFRLEVPALDIGPGDRLALVGPSGSGKSLCLELLCLLRQCHSCEVFSLRLRNGEWCHFHQIAAGDYDRAGQAYRRHQIAILLQSGGLLQSLTARGNVALAREVADRHDIDIVDLFKALDIAPLLDRKIAHMSGGQRQRVALARAIAAKPMLLFADEPTSALDPQTARRVLQLISMCADGEFIGASVIVTHEARLARECNFEVLALAPLEGGDWRGSRLPERVLQ